MSTKHSEQQLVLKIFQVITAHQPITMRDLTRKFNSSQRKTVERMALDAVAFGTLVSAGTGVKGSPLTIRLAEHQNSTEVPLQTVLEV